MSCVEGGDLSRQGGHKGLGPVYVSMLVDDT